MDFSIFKKSLDEFKAQIDKKTKHLEKLKQEYDVLHTKPLPREDLAELLKEWLDLSNERFFTDLGHKLNHLVGNPLKSFNRAFPFNFLGSASGQSGTHSVHAVNFIFNDQLKSAIERAVLDPRFDWPSDTGLPRKERLARLNKLDKEIEQAQNELNILVEQANKAGLRI